MKIWAHTLVKNEARWLWYSVGSVIDHVDKLLLYDSGSTDGSLEIEKEIVKKYPEKIIHIQKEQNENLSFEKIRQEMLDVTKSDWFIVVDADEIWWEESINNLIETIKIHKDQIESVVVPTFNLVGDIYHYQEKAAGGYHFGNLIGHYNLRAVCRQIDGLHSQGPHGIWGWADSNDKMIQERDPKNIYFLNSPYIHATFLPRASKKKFEYSVLKRQKKLKHEIGIEFPKDFYYPEIFFKEKPEIVPSPWQTMSVSFRSQSIIETPLRKIKRRFLPQNRVGY